MKKPNQKMHRKMSFIKSGLRIFAGLLLTYILQDGAIILNCIAIAGFLFIIAEIIGIIEELV